MISVVFRSNYYRELRVYDLVLGDDLRRPG